jgi:2-polyprenyl-3-methyl-5-hydroxy-6-metoxy-1,4-benzoquinol methylase
MVGNNRNRTSDRAKLLRLKRNFFVENTHGLSDHSFDVVSMWHVLEHVPDLDLQIKELKEY